MYKTLSIIIPAYNEKKTIEKLIKKVKSADTGNLKKDIIVVDDGSKDGTREILKKIPNIRYIFHKKNLGKGGGLKTGIKAAKGEIVIFQDADLEYDPNEYSTVIAPILNGETEAVNGVRIQPERDERRKKSLYWLSWFGNEVITWTTNLLFLKLHGEYEGCYKAFTKKLLDSVKVKTNDFDFDNELLCKLFKRGYKVIDVPIHYYPRSYAEGKKINWKHGFIILGTIIKCRFSDKI